MGRPGGGSLSSTRSAERRWPPGAGTRLTDDDVRAEPNLGPLLSASGWRWWRTTTTDARYLAVAVRHRGRYPRGTAAAPGRTGPPRVPGPRDVPRNGPVSPAARPGPSRSRPGRTVPPRRLKFLPSALDAPERDWLGCADRSKRGGGGMAVSEDGCRRRRRRRAVRADRGAADPGAVPERAGRRLPGGLRRARSHPGWRRLRACARPGRCGRPLDGRRRRRVAGRGGHRLVGLRHGVRPVAGRTHDHRVTPRVAVGTGGRRTGGAGAARPGPGAAGPPLAPPDTGAWGPAQRRLAADEIALQWAAWRGRSTTRGPPPAGTGPDGGPESRTPRGRGGAGGPAEAGRSSRARAYAAEPPPPGAVVRSLEGGARTLRADGPGW